MKIKMFSNLLAATAVLSSAAWLNTTPAQANPASSFSCGVDRDGTPATIVRHPQHGDVTLIRWVSPYFERSGYDAQTRCEMVSQRFQNFQDSGKLTFLTTGIMNREHVVCVSPIDRGECDGLLFTIKRTSNPSQTLQDLLGRRALASGSESLEETGSRLYINFEDCVRDAAAAQSGAQSDSALF